MVGERISFPRRIEEQLVVLDGSTAARAIRVQTIIGFAKYALTVGELGRVCARGTEAPCLVVFISPRACVECLVVHVIDTAAMPRVAARLHFVSKHPAAAAPFIC